MEKISKILKNIYSIEWNNLNILECGAHKFGEETSDLESENNCWYIEANIHDYEILKSKRRNTLNLALSNKDGKINFIVSSHEGNSSCEYSKEHLDELKKYNTSFKEIEIDCISYNSLLNKLNLIFDVFVLDIEGHEKTFLLTWKEIDIKYLPTILVIECGYDWKERKSILIDLGYKIDCYYFNNCFLSKKEIQKNQNYLNQYNQEWKKFVWDNKTIYVNELL